MTTLSIYINQQLAYEYDKPTNLNDGQSAFLDKMDSDMGRGVKIYGEIIPEPDQQQRATFVAMNMIKALMQQDEAKIQVACAYLSSRIPKLDRIDARDDEGRVKIELTRAESEA